MWVTTKDKTWELLHSLWIGWTFTLGLFNWIAFLYIGLRTNQRKWMLWGVLYLMPIAFVFFLLTIGASAGWGAIAVLSTLVAGVASVFHAFRVRMEYLARLEALLDGSQAQEKLLKQRLGNEPQPGQREAVPAQSESSA